VDKKVG